MLDSDDLRGSVMCGVVEPPDGVRTGVCKWPHSRITYYENMTLSGLTRQEVKDTFDEAINLWAKVANLTFVRLDSPDKANIVADTGFMALAVGVSYLPCGYPATGKVTQKYRSNRTWGKRDFREVACHELGHALGLSHLGSNTIMAAVAMGHNEPQPGDIVEIQKRYGKPLVTPDVPKPDEPDSPAPFVQPTAIKVGSTVMLMAKKDQVYPIKFNIESKGFWDWLGFNKAKVEATSTPDSILEVDGVKSNKASVSSGSHMLYVKAMADGFLWVTLK